MVRRGLVASPLLAWLALAAPACHTRSYAPDAGVDASGDSPAADVPGALTLDFAATGCARGDGGVARGDGGVAPCAGAPPLTLTFSPVSSAALTRFLWTFGDGTAASTERAPTHTYVQPRTYDVSLVAEGAFGSVSRDHPGFVEVTPIPTGAPCDVDAQCGPGLFCLCGQEAPCGDGFPRGLCTSACAQAGCGAGAACARVTVQPVAIAAAADAGTTTGDAGAPQADASASDAPMDLAMDFGATDAVTDVATDFGGAADAPADLAADFGAPADASGGDRAADAGASDGGVTSTAVCLASCSDDTSCAAGLVCRALPGAAAGATWASVCVPPALRAVGDACRDARGQLAATSCASDVCADLGALGACSASCGAGVPCPPGTTCATFGDGRTLCLAPCSTSAPCTRDPLLACEKSGGGGALGFVVSPPTPTTTFCAPHSCTSQADCSPSGTCTPLGVGAHCQLN